MESTKGFYDFGVLYNKDEKEMRDMIKELIEMGYKTIAIEQTFDHTKKSTIKRGADIFPEPVSIGDLQNEFKQQIKILQRLTIIYTEAAIAHAMTNSLNLKKFNLIAGQPKNDAALTHCCMTLGCDLITFDPEAGSKLMVNRKAYQVAIKRGVFFEIKYAPAIRDSNNRKDMIKIAHNYGVRGKLRSIIFSSGAENVFELRGPYDVANLAYIFGMSEDQGKNAVDKSCRQLFLRAESRRLGKTIMFVKSSGPICLSDTSDEGDNDDDDDDDDDESESVLEGDEESEKKDIKSAKSDGEDEDSNKNAESEDEEMISQPNKKKKLS